MENRKPYVRIQSQQTIRVTVGLNNQDNTNPDAHVADRLKISSLWPKAMMVINVGAHLYPSEIIDWPTVRALEKDGVITIGSFEDTAGADVVKKREELLRGLKSIGAYEEPKVEKVVEDDSKAVAPGINPTTGEVIEETEVEPKTLAERIGAIHLSDIAK